MGRRQWPPPHEWCKAETLAGLAVGRAVTFDRAGVEGGGAAEVEAGTGRYEGVFDDAAGVAAGAQLDAGGVDALLLCEVLLYVEGALGGRVGLLIGGVFADDDELGGGVAVEGEGDLVEAALGLVVDADGTLAVALEGDTAEAAWLRRRWGRRRRNGDRGGGCGLFAQVVDYVAGDDDGAGRCS